MAKKIEYSHKCYAHETTMKSGDSREQAVARHLSRLTSQAVVVSPTGVESYTGRFTRHAASVGGKHTEVCIYNK
jgi:hypothetical protein